MATADSSELSKVNGQSNMNGEVPPAKVSASKKDKKKKKKKKKRHHQEKPRDNVEENTNEKHNEDVVEIEYVPANPLEDLDPSNPLYQEFASIFQRFQPKEEEGEQSEDQQKGGTAAEENNGEEDEEDDEDKPKISKKEKKRQKRLSIAVLKQLVKRPDVVEAWDVTSSDPGLLVYLKSYRNTVPIPRHWNQKRKYLQGKRGIEKPPFALPDFIAATGISKIRAAIQEKADQKTSKQKQRERAQAKLGKMDIDYQVLHDAFFKYQTKPKLTIHGDLYYEGKEFEITLKEKRPGHLSEDLKRALGMPDGAPPPWLLNMQRFGPPPSYPNLKIPGLNAQLPEGARYGFHPGGWGKPPVDEFGRPLYGDVFGTAPPEPPPEITQPIERKHWGEIEEEEEEENVEMEEEAEQQDEEATQQSGIETPSSGLTTPSGMDTPEVLELRKAPAATRRTDEEDDSNKQLFQVIQQTETSVGNALVGSSHKYIIPGTTTAATSDKKEPKAKDRVNLIHSQATEKLDITLNPSEVENLEELTPDMLQKKYEAELAKNKEVREDVSDIMEEHAKKKRKKEGGKDKDKDKKKYKEFKF